MNARDKIDATVRVASIAGYDPAVTNAIIAIFREAMMDEAVLDNADDHVIHEVWEDPEDGVKEDVIYPVRDMMRAALDTAFGKEPT